MNTEQERAFEQILHSIQQAQIPGNDWRRELKLIESTCRAALQSQEREDAERLDWLENIGSVDIVKTLDGKTEVFAPHNDLVYAAAGSLREAIDHARRVEGDV